jgi:hypothetical protein
MSNPSFGIAPAFIDLSTFSDTDNYMYSRGTPGNPVYYTNYQENEPSTFGLDKQIRPYFWAPKGFIKQCMSSFVFVILILIFLMYIKA